MPRPRIALLVGLLLGAAAATAASAQPPTEVSVVRDTLHGVVVEDPYRWLEDQQSPATRAWIDAQNAYTDRILERAPGAEAIRARLEPLMLTETVSVPVVRGGRYFYSRRQADQQLAVLCVRERLDGPERILVDPHAMSSDQTTSVGLSAISRDGKLVGYTIRIGGEDEVALAFREVDSGRDLPDRLPRGRYFGVSLLPDGTGLYYTKQTPLGPRVYHHSFGADPAVDPIVFGEGIGPEKIASAILSTDGRYLLFTVAHGSASRHDEIYLLDRQGSGPPVTIVNEVKASFTPRLAGDRLYLLTDWKAPNGRILAVDLRDPVRERWREVVREGPNAIQSFWAVGGKLFVSTLENVVSVVRIHDLAGRAEGSIRFPTLGSVGDVSGQWDDDEAFFTFASFHIPTTIYRHQVSSGRRSEWWRAPAPIESERFEVRQVWFPSKDGTRIPMFLAHRKGLKLDGSAPTLLSGYGGFNLSQKPSFSARAAFWIESGGVFALANLRGGSEFGEPWHEAGMLDRKQNVFDDFIAAAEWLIEKRYTRREKLAIYGRSNGGLLVAAALTQRPDLFGAVVCGFPLIDMLRYHRFLVARYWVPEYGSADDPAQFEFLRAYSPYQRVKQGERYPAVLVMSGDSDTRVAPLHARKLTARLQAATGSGRPVALLYDTVTGHVSGKPIRGQLDDLAREMQFLLWQLDTAPQPAGARSGPGS